MDAFIAFLASPAFGNFLALAVVFLVILGMFRMHRSIKNKFDFSDLFIDQKTGKIGGSEFRINSAFLVTTWALIFLTVKMALTEWFLAAYLAAFVADRAFSRNAATKDNTNVKTDDEVK